MATGDANDIAQRVRRVLPRRWFQWGAPIRDALLGGLADSAAWNYSLIAYARLQTRLRTATGPWLDIASRDFLGSILPRRMFEVDTSFSTRIINEVLRPRNTRGALSLLLTQLTGIAPQLSEAFNTGDYGSWGTGEMAYGAGEGYGSLALNNQVFITAFRSPTQGIPIAGGYGTYNAGYGAGFFEYSDPSVITGPLTDAEIYARIAQTIAAGITAWVALQSGGGGPYVAMLRFNDKRNSQYFGAM